MKANWLVTPYFFDERDDALAEAVAPDVSYDLNPAGGPKDRRPENLGPAHREIAQYVTASTKAGNLPISIAGDCSASLPVMAGLQQADLSPVLVWLDAHGDFNTQETSPSGFLGGMPLAMMVGRGDLSLPRASGQSPVAETDVWLVDARDLDPLEAEALAASKLTRLTIDGLDDLTFDRPVHLHIDNDIIDALDVPANNYPVPNGPSLALVTEKAAAFAARNAICGISFSGWNSALDHDGRTAMACRDLLSATVRAATMRQ